MLAFKDPLYAHTHTHTRLDAVGARRGDVAGVVIESVADLVVVVPGEDQRVLEDNRVT